jgi:hypothetical protein
MSVYKNNAVSQQEDHVQITFSHRDKSWRNARKNLNKSEWYLTLKKHMRAYQTLLWQALEQASISEHIIDILKSIYSNNRCQGIVGYCLSREFLYLQETSSRMLHITNPFKTYTDIKP